MFNAKKVCIFVDGENLRHSIEDLFPYPSFDKRDYLPKKADWTKFFDWVASETIKSDSETIKFDVERIRTYWYAVQDIDYFPYALNAVRKEDNRDHIKNILSKDEKTKERLSEIVNYQKQSEFMREKIDELLENQYEMERRSSGWIDIQDKIARYGKSIEFRRAGSIRYNLFERRLGYEKAVDVKLATDLIKLKDMYDVAIIVSGDQDYVPAVEVIKDFGKHAVNIAFLTEGGRLLPGGARKLNESTDWSIEVKHSDFKRYLGL